MINVSVLHRLRFLRKDVLKLNQKEFGRKIGLSKSNISNIEIGRIDLTERNINVICKTFNVNEIWLRTGDGGEENMFVEIRPENRYLANLRKLSESKNQFIQNMVNYLAETEPEDFCVIMRFMKDCSEID